MTSRASHRAASNGGKWGLVGLGLLALGQAACAKKPPPDFAPSPSLLPHITGMRVLAPEWACPGQRLPVEYEALLDDGRAIPFETRYDDKHPPQLHVVFLRRTSREAVPRDDGSWSTVDDPLVSVMDGFRLYTEMRHKPSIHDTTVVAPDYSCLRHAFQFEGAPGRRGEAGGPGPDAVVRLDVLASPFYDRLLVTEIQVGAAPPFYLFADADQVAPADWLLIASRGGHGGRGLDGDPGGAGTVGASGCPAGAGGAGGAGSAGGPGGPGGPGGSVTVIVPQDLPYLAGLVDARSVGGPGGPGGPGGKGGAGGAGGKGVGANGQRCADGAAGQAGSDGPEGRVGRDGPIGGRPQILTVPAGQVFGPHVPLPIRDLIDYTNRTR